jgi:hypothetical protein
MVAVEAMNSYKITISFAAEAEADVDIVRKIDQLMNDISYLFNPEEVNTYWDREGDTHETHGSGVMSKK